MSTPTRIAWTRAPSTPPPRPGSWQWHRIATAIAADPTADDQAIARVTRLARAHVAHVRARLPEPTPWVCDACGGAEPHVERSIADPQRCKACVRRATEPAPAPEPEPVIAILDLSAALPPLDPPPAEVAAPDRRPAATPRTPAAPTACCLRCRLELPNPKRLEVHVAAAHPAEPPPAPAPTAPAEVAATPAPVAPAPRAASSAPSCGCGGPFARDPADHTGRCLKCSGAYERAIGRRFTSFRATYAAAAAD